VRCHSNRRACREARRDDEKITIERGRKVHHMQHKRSCVGLCTVRIGRRFGGGKSKAEEKRRRRTNEIGVIRPKLLVQFDCVRFVYGVPERHPVGDYGVDVFRCCIPSRRNRGVAKGGHPHTHVRPLAKESNFEKVGEHTPHLRESVRKPALTSFSSAPVRPARAPIVCKKF
jgi:hypothetical protein